MVRESKSFDAGRRPPFIVRAVTALVAVTLTLIVCEIALRYLYPQGGQPLIYDFDPSLGHRMRAGVDMVQVWDNHENVSRVRTNSLGLRGAEIPAAKAPGERESSCSATLTPSATGSATKIRSRPFSSAS
jgi:hypothetical protein